MNEILKYALRASGERSYSLVHRESMINSSWQCDHVSLSQCNSDPAVTFVSNVKVRSSVQDVTDLVVEVQMFLIEGF